MIKINYHLDEASRRIKNELLKQLDGIRSSRSNGIFIMARSI